MTCLWLDMPKVAYHGTLKGSGAERSSAHECDDVECREDGGISEAEWLTLCLDRMSDNLLKRVFAQLGFCTVANTVQKRGI